MRRSAIDDLDSQISLLSNIINQRIIVGPWQASAAENLERDSQNLIGQLLLYYWLFNVICGLYEDKIRKKLPTDIKLITEVINDWVNFSYQSKGWKLENM